MASKLRTPALVGSLIAAVLIILVEMGASFRASFDIFDDLGSRVTELEDSFGSLGSDGASDNNDKVGSFPDLEGQLKVDKVDLPGLAVPALFTLDILLLTTLILFNLPLVISPRVVAQLQGIVAFIMGIVVILLALFTLLKALVMVFLMVGLLLAIPFGTIIYMVMYADFDTTGAAAVMSTLMFLKVVMSALLLIAHERFLLNLGMIALIATSIIAMIIVGFLHNFPPSFIVSITDSVAAIVVAILAIIWGIIHLIGGLIGIIKMILGLHKLTD